MFKKNVSGKERVARVGAGALMMCIAYVTLGATPLGWLVGGVGLVTLATGLVRYCPACAIAGREPVESSSNS